MANTIVILEDDPQREARMRLRCHDRFPHKFRSFPTAAAAIGWLYVHRADVAVLSLDHDLEPSSDDDDPGTGRVVVEFLTTIEPEFPTIIHSSNAEAAIGMQQRLTEMGWNAARIIPHDDLAWVDQDWFPAIRARLLAVGDAAKDVLPLGAGSGKQ